MNPPASAGDVRDVSSTPGSGRSPAGGPGNPFHYSRLENPVDRGAWGAAVLRVTESRTWLSWLSTCNFCYGCSTLTTSSKADYLPEAPTPNIIWLEMASMNEFWRNTNIQSRIACKNYWLLSVLRSLLQFSAETMITFLPFLEPSRHHPTSCPLNRLLTLTEMLFSQIYIYIHTHTYIYTHTHIYTHMWIYSYSCLRIPTDRGALRATVHGVAKSRIHLSDFHTHTHTHTHTPTHTHFLSSLCSIAICSVMPSLDLSWLNWWPISQHSK